MDPLHKLHQFVQLWREVSNAEVVCLTWGICSDTVLVALNFWDSIRTAWCTRRTVVLLNVPRSLDSTACKILMIFFIRIRCISMKFIACVPWCLATLPRQSASLYCASREQHLPRATRQSSPNGGGGDSMTRSKTPYFLSNSEELIQHLWHRRKDECSAGGSYGLFGRW